MQLGWGAGLVWPCILDRFVEFWTDGQFTQAGQALERSLDTGARFGRTTFQPIDMRLRLVGECLRLFSPDLSLNDPCLSLITSGLHLRKAITQSAVFMRETAGQAQQSLDTLDN